MTIKDGRGMTLKTAFLLLAVGLTGMWIFYPYSGLKSTSTSTTSTANSDTSYQDNGGLVSKDISGRIINIRSGTIVYNIGDIQTTQDSVIITLQLTRACCSEDYTGQIGDININQGQFDSFVKTPMAEKGELPLHNGEMINTKWLCNKYVCGLNGFTVTDARPDIIPNPADGGRDGSHYYNDEK
jgi:hypothetical protein